MSISNGSMHLPGTPESLLPLRKCDKCRQMVNPYGGVQISPTRFHCASCWRRPLLATNRKKA